MDRDFGQLREAWEQLDLEAITNRVIDNTVDTLADMTRAQLYAGYDSEGQRLPRYRSASYARLKYEMNPTPGLFNPDYYLTGAYHARIRAERFGEEIEVTSYDSKAEKLEARTGGGDPEVGAALIYGPTPEHHNEYVEDLLEPGILDELHKAVRL